MVAEREDAEAAISTEELGFADCLLVSFTAVLPRKPVVGRTLDLEKKSVN